RVTRKESKGGPPSNQQWVDVPESFRSIPMPDWPLPTDLKKWEQSDRDKTRQTLLSLIGDMPARPDPKRVHIIKSEEHDGYRLERFQFHNGVDMVVPGIILIPSNLKAPAPTIVVLHGHSSSKESV